MKQNETSSSALKPTNFNISTQNSNVMEMGMDIENGNQISAFFFCYPVRYIKIRIVLLYVSWFPTLLMLQKQLAQAKLARLNLLF